MFAYFGTYTNSGKSKGIYCYAFDPASGSLTETSSTGGIENPSFLAIHPNKKYLYAVSEKANPDGKTGGTVWAYSIDKKSGKLTAINHQSSEGAGPCHISVDKTGQCALVANYDSGNVIALPIKSDGSLGKAESVVQHEGSSINPERQKSAHAHSINVSSNNKFALAADLGLDKILIYKFNAKKAKLQKSNPSHSATIPGGGPRHLAFHPNERHAYIANEMISSVTAFEYNDKDGSLTEIQTISTLPDKTPNNSTAEILIHPSGKFAYCSNRGHDSIAVFKIDPKSGKLSAIGHQKTLGTVPRNFSIDPSGMFLIACNQTSDNVVVFKINQDTGLLSPVGTPTQIPSPVCVKFLSTQEK